MWWWIGGAYAAMSVLTTVGITALSVRKCGEKYTRENDGVICLLGGLWPMAMALFGIYFAYGMTLGAMKGRTDAKSADESA
jgi:hypothetical protein